MKKEINPFNRGDLANCLVFHDFDISKIDLSTVFDYVENLFSEYNLIPTRMGILKSLNDSRSMKTYIRERKKLIDLKAKDILAVGVKATSYNSDDSQSDNIFSAALDTESLGHFVLTLDDQLFLFDKQKIKIVIKKIIELLNPCYGYCYQRTFKKGAIWYPYGVISGIPFGDPEEDKIDNWAQKLRPDHPQAYKTGDLRDIYPINLLVDAHLTRTVLPNISFEQFITLDERYGILENITDGHYTWVVDDVNILLVREALRPSGMIIAG